MAYVTAIYGGSAEQIDYRLGLTQHGCDSDVQFRYHADGRERPLRWIGRGLPEFGLDGLTAGAELTTEQHDLARSLMAGKHPVTGEQLVAPKLAVPADAKVPLGPLVAAAQALAAERGLDDPVDMFAKPKQRSAFNTAVRAVARRGDAALLRVDDALALAETAGLEAEQVWPDVDLLATYSNLYEPQAVVDEAGKPELDENGQPKIELTPRRVPVGIVGFDIGITLPKSASLLLAFLPDDLVAQVEASYTAAIERTFGWVEGRTSYVRRGKHGDGHAARQEQTAGFAGWVMTHRAARPVGDAAVGDPHWHVHITIANMAKAPDGTWLTVAAGGRDLMRHAPAIDKVTQAQVRAFLHNQLGITFTRSARTGVWEVAQIPDEAIRYFSKRGQQVSAVLQQLGYSNADVSAAEARILTRESRSAKSETTAASDATLRGLWRADAVRGGLDPDTLMDRVLTAYRSGMTTGPVEANHELEARFGISLDDLVAKLTDPEHGLTAHARRFSHLDAVAAVADALPHGAEIEDVERLTDLALAHPAFQALPTAGVDQALAGPGAHTQLAGAHQMSGGTLYTTKDVTAAERTILAAATAASDPTADVQDRARVPAATVDLALGVVETAQGFPLSAEQRDVLHRVVTNGRAVEAVEGPPGTGKTTLMRAARVAWEAAGYKVAGAATAAVAAQNLAAESGIVSRTVAQWLWRIDNRDGFAGIDVLVLDEANLTSDRDRAKLYTAAAEAGTKIVEVGDPQQLRGVGVGSMFGYLHQLLGGARLTDNRRQRQADERNALAAFRDGRHAEALHTWARLGELVATETSDEAVAAMVSTWLRLREGAPDPHALTAGLLMLAATNEQVARINEATQAVRQARGELGDSANLRLPGGRETRFHVGDLVLIRRNDRHQQAVTGDMVLNGYRGVVTAVTGEGVEVAWRDPAADTEAEPSRAVLSPGYIAQGGLELGYALTAHKAEGLTVSGQWERPDGTRNDGSVLVYGPGMDNPGLYVSLSRDKGQAMLFGARAELEGEREELFYGPPRNQQELTDRVIAALAERAAATADNANDRPVLVDLAQAPADPTGTGTVSGTGTTAETVAPVPSAPVPEPVRPPDFTEPAPTAQPDRSQPRSRPGREPVTVTDEQRQQWQDLVRRSVAARVADDRDTYRALQAQRRDLTAQLGPERVEVLRAESHQKAMQTLEQRRERQIQERLERLRLEAQWQNRPHSRLTDTQLTHAIRDTERRQAREVAAAEQARRQLSEREQAVAAGRGPRVTQLDSELHRLRVNAERQGTLEEIERRWQHARTQAADAAERAARKEIDAERTRWWQPGRREQLQAEAAADRALQERAHAEVAELARYAAELQQQLGGPGAWRQARPQLERAEATYVQDRQRAHDTDQHELTRLGERIASYDTAALDAGTRREELLTERQLRDAMPDTQRTLERQLRIQETLKQRQQTLDHATLERQPEPSLQADVEYHQRTLHTDIHQDIERGGPSL
ncbi:MobF family relaxase [Actinophytocola oryzae]|uniref:Conjugative relaxase-like TrwC/TraI family protein n=1 Tax=Actinophytocola oryzae TaxID=502181 RepID=A0A4R7V8W0_9PSEU|nr:MobF family relaxase [Actinophytocola oryzae]TDV45342.1 conjugative relaxase-like TrwC/TraI family protein [Actinophytocola oryzae]